MKRQNKYKISKIFKGIIFTFKLIFKSKEGFKYSFFKLFLVLLNNLAPIILTIFPGLIINELLGQRRPAVIIPYVLILAVVPMANTLVNILSNRHIDALEYDLCLRLMVDFYRHSLRMDYETLENPDIQDQADRAMDTYTCCTGIIDEVIVFFTAIINVIIYSWVIVRYDISIIGLIAVVILINFFVKKNVREKMFDRRKEIDKLDRKLSHLFYMLGRHEYGKEFRLFDLSDFLLNKYSKEKKASNKLLLETTKKSSKVNVVASITNCIQQIVIYFIFIAKILADKLSVGDLTIGLSATGQFSGKLSSLMEAYLELYNRSMYIDEMEDFFNIPSRNMQSGKTQPVFDENSVFEFRNVSFKYPGSEKYAIENLNITIKASEKLCIVGQNGAGKTTFIKLLTRLYFPTEGEILLNGINIFEYDYAQYLRLFAPVFQDFVNYEFSIKESIILNAPEDNGRFEEVMEKVGLKQPFSQLPHGYDTLVGKYIDPEGFEPSGGEAQRMAIARTLYRGGSVYLLDEPTAALDPLQEYEIYTQFNDMITDKCAILITHRLSAVQLADKVAVFDGGRVVEYGTHAELYAKDGIYTEMFDKQAQFYRDEGNNQKNCD